MEIYEPFAFVSTKYNISVIVHAGFQTDLASIPQAVRSLVPKIGYWSQAAAVHDLLYYNHRHGIDIKITRLIADKVLREAAKVKALEYRVPDHRRREWTLYNGVRLFSEPYWMTPAEKAANIALHDNSDIIDN